LVDGEGTERLWSFLRPFGKITKEMSLDNRRDLLMVAMDHYCKRLVWKLGLYIIENYIGPKLKHVWFAVGGLKPPYPNVFITKIWKDLFYYFKFQTLKVSAYQTHFRVSAWPSQVSAIAQAGACKIATHSCTLFVKHITEFDSV
jgi:hypothetical protein